MSTHQITSALLSSPNALEPMIDELLGHDGKVVRP
jgi:hypothetical protein